MDGPRRLFCSKNMKGRKSLKRMTRRRGGGLGANHMRRLFQGGRLSRVGIGGFGGGCGGWTLGLLCRGIRGAKGGERGGKGGENQGFLFVREESKREGKSWVFEDTIFGLYLCL